MQKDMVMELVISQWLVPKVLMLKVMVIFKQLLMAHMPKDIMIRRLMGRAHMPKDMAAHT